MVLKAVSSLCEVFCEIIPSYRIREIQDVKKEEDDDKKDEKSKKHLKLSRDVEEL